MAAIHVDVKARTLTAFGETVPCVLGRGGAVAAADKREGDGCTPLGVYALRALLLRPDRNPVPATRLAWRWLRSDDGWSDDGRDPAYNRPVRHPHAFSAEQLWRRDGLYDLIVVLGHNDAPPVPGRGSAIFLHCTRDDGSGDSAAGTAGCIAIARDALWRIIAAAGPSDVIAIA
jgi:L,D-peptidoglycan transpeptidase YkuD (ErfK/YbiS/YcfS/YnhG family)